MEEEEERNEYYDCCILTGFNCTTRYSYSWVLGVGE